MIGAGEVLVELRDKLFQGCSEAQRLSNRSLFPCAPAPNLRPAMGTEAPQLTNVPFSEPIRRDLLFIATSATGAVAAAATLVPLIEQMNPDASTLAAGAPIELDLGEVEPGGYVVVLRRKRPIFVVSRTPEMLKALQDPKLLNELADPQSEQHQQPPYANNWHRSLTPEIAVLVGVCTHLGCIPQFDPLPNALEPDAN